MVDVPYHTHTFDIPTASEGEIRAGIEAGKAITPDRLFPVLADKADKATTLAGYGITDAATEDQGKKADTAVQPERISMVGFSGEYNDLQNKPDLGGASGLNVGTTAGTVAAGNDARIVNAVQQSITVSAGEGLTGGGALAENIALALSSTSLASLALANSAVQPSQLAPYATKAELSSGLAGKSDTGHKHPISDVTGLQSALDAKAATVHTHSIAQVTGLQTALDGKASDEQGAKADTAVQPADIANFATKAELSSGLSTKLEKDAQATDSAMLEGYTADALPISTATQTALDGKATAAQGAKADTAVQPSDLGALAKKDKIATSDIDATGSSSSGALLTQGGIWIDPSGGGDMFRATYDPTNKATDAFSMGHMTETATAKIMTDTERTRLAGMANGATANTGTVTSVAVAVPTGFTVTGAITTSGTITISYASGYQAYTTAEANKLAGISADADKTPALATVATTGAYGDLSGRPTIPAAQVQTDWNAASGIALIANKPATFPPATHTHTPDQVGLNNVANKSEAQMVASGAIADALEGKLPSNAQAADSARLGNKTAVQWQTEVDDLKKQFFGNGQVWQPVSRPANTVFQNTTGRTIFITVNISSGYGTFQMSPDNVNWSTASEIGGGQMWVMGMPIPNGYYYKTTTGGSYRELR